MTGSAEKRPDNLEAAAPAVEARRPITIMQLRGEFQGNIQEAMSPKARLKLYLKGNEKFAKFQYEGMHEEQVRERKLMELHTTFKMLVSLDDDELAATEALIIRKFLRNFFDMYGVKSGATYEARRASFIQETLEFIILLRDCYAEKNDEFRQFLEGLLEELKSDIRLELDFLRNDQRDYHSGITLIKLAKELGITQEDDNEDLDELELALKKEAINMLFKEKFLDDSHKYMVDRVRWEGITREFFVAVENWGIEPDYSGLEELFAGEYKIFEERLKEFESQTAFKNLGRLEYRLRKVFSVVQSLSIRADLLGDKVSLTTGDDAPFHFDEMRSEYTRRVFTVAVKLFIAYRDEVFAQAAEIIENNPGDCGDVVRPIRDIQLLSEILDNLNIDGLEERIQSLLQESVAHIVEQVIPRKIAVLASELPSADQQKRKPLSRNIEALTTLLRDLS